MSGSTSNKRVNLNRKMTKLFIHLYKKNNCLYDPTHEHYHSRTTKNASLKNILHEMQKYLPDLQLGNVRSKIKTIRSQFAHELTILRAMEKAGIVYIPKLWCFQQLSFLRKFMSRLPNNEQEVCADKQLLCDDRSDSNDGGESFYHELAEIESSKRSNGFRRINFKWTRGITEHFIKLYKRYKCLYDPKHKDFADQRIRDGARKHLLREMKQFVPWISMQDILIKRKCLRDQYSRELKLLAMAKENNGEYHPKLWCFQQLSFLKSTSHRDLTPHRYTESDTAISEIADSSSNEDSSDIEESDLLDNVYGESDFDANEEDSNLEDEASLNYFDAEKKCKEDTSGDEETIYGSTDFNENERNSNHEDESDGDTDDEKKGKEDSSGGDNNIYGETDINENREHSNHENDTSCDDTDVEKYKHIVSNRNWAEMNLENCDEIEYDESVLTSKSNPIMEISNDVVQSDEEIFDSKENVKKTRSLGEKAKIEGIKLNDFSINKGLTNYNGRSRYEWLGQFVISQLEEISPSHHKDFAWDIQCLIRKYILKTDATKSSKKSSLGLGDHTKNLILPRSSNVSLNISFL